MLEWLKSILGESYTDEIDKKVSEEIGKGFVAKTDFNNVKTELKTAKDTIADRDKQLEALKESTGDVEALKQTITGLQADNAAKDKEHAAEIARLKLDAAVEHALSDAHARNMTAAKAMMAGFLKDAVMDEDGSVRGLAEEVKKLTESEDTSFLFEAKTTNTGNTGMAGAAPAGNGAASGTSSTGGSTSAPTLSDAISAAMFGNTK